MATMEEIDALIAKMREVNTGAQGDIGAAQAKAKQPTATEEAESNERFVKGNELAKRTWARAVWGAKETPEGKQSALRAIYPKGVEFMGDNAIVTTDSGKRIMLDPKGFRGDVAGELAQQAVPIIKGAVAAGVAAPLSLSGVGAPLSLAAGGMASGLVGQGIEAMTPGEVNRPIEERALSMAGDVAGEMAGGAAGSVAGKVLKARAPIAIGGEGFTTKGRAIGRLRQMVGEGVETPSQFQQGATIGEHAAQVGKMAGAAEEVAGLPANQARMESAKAAEGIAGQRLKLSAGQMTGDPVLLQAEKTAAMTPATARQAQAFRNSQLDFGTKVIKGAVDQIAADPDKLGRADVAAGLFGGLNTAMRAYEAAGLKAAREAYKAADADPSKLIPVNTTLDTIEMLKRSLLPDDQKRLAKLSDQISEMAGEDGVITIAQWGELKSALQEGMTGKGTLADKMLATGKKEKRRFGKIVDALRDDFAVAEEMSPGNESLAAKLRGDELFAAYKQQEAKVIDDSVKSLLKIEKSGSPEKALRTVANMSPEAIGNLFKLIRMAPDGEGVTRQIGARILMDIAEKGGYASQTVLGSTLYGTAGAALSPAKVAGGMAKKADVLGAIYKGNAKAADAARTVFELMRTIDLKPPTMGSDTYANSAASPLVGALLDKLASVIPDDVRKMAPALFDVPQEKVFELMLDFNGVETVKQMAQVLQPTASQKRNKVIAKQSLAALLNLAGQAGVGAGGFDTEMPTNE